MWIPEYVTTFQIILLFLCALLIGMTKSGLSGAGLMIVPIMANIFGSRESTGIVLPMLITADIFAVTYYNRHAHWKYILRLMPWAILGVGGGLYFGKHVNDHVFSNILVAIVVMGIGLMLYGDLRKKSAVIPDYWWFSMALGVGGGFTSMVGNAAGPILMLYLLSMRLPKNAFIGTGAWFFFILNLTKVPVHIVSWHTITLDTLKINLLCVPFIIAGIITGIFTVKLFKETAYRYFIIISTLISAIFLLI
ncbi:MAG: sulfite exporter TauE/SafE family protein [bacterium]|jgi:uncharacterized protein